MGNSEKIFHLAIPCRDLDEAREYYVEGLGCRLARRYEDRITFDFFGNQLVCHLAPEQVEAVPRMYPRHFGITFMQRSDFDRVLDKARSKKLTFFQEPMTRFEQLRETHRTFFLIDPSNNLIEFKHYQDPEMRY